MIRANSLLGRIRRLWRGYNDVERIVVVDDRDDLPVRLGNDMYVVGPTKPKWAILECPCGCRQRIDVNLMTSRRPFWELRKSNRLVSLSPSLWRGKGTCESHFWVRDSKIVWARD